MAIDFYTTAEIESDFRRIDDILGSGIFSPEGSKSPLFQSALTELLIRVRDLLAKAENHGKKRVAFTDDVTVKGNVTDVTSLISFVRDAVCHIDSKKNDHDEIQARISFNTVFGKGCLMVVNGVRIESVYNDDIAFFFGPQRLYLNRHIARAYRDAAEILKPLIKPEVS